MAKDRPSGFYCYFLGRFSSGMDLYAAALVPCPLHDWRYLSPEHAQSLKRGLGKGGVAFWRSGIHNLKLAVFIFFGCVFRS